MNDLENLGYLIVDDDVTTCHIVSELITRVVGSQKMHAFTDSTSFKAQLANLPFKPDFIFLDIFVLPIDGYEMLKLLQADAHYHQSKIVALTASVMPQYIDQMKEAGFDSMISKPIIFDVFPNLLELIWAGEEIWYIA